MTNEQILRKAGRILKDPKKRTRKAYARNKYRHSVLPTSPSACKFCLVGAIKHVDKDNVLPDGIFDILGERLKAALNQELYSGAVCTWDAATDKQQDIIANTLANYREQS